MKAAYIDSHGGPDVIRVGDLPTPDCGPGQVRVKVKVAAMNHLDIWIRKGLPGLKLSYPHVLGSDGFGIVDAVGTGVSKVKVGDEVIIHPGLSCGKCAECTSGTESLCPEYKILGEQTSGTNAEFVVLPEANAFLKPKSLSAEEAASIALVYTTAWEMLVVKAKVKKGDFVLVHGAGSGVSSAAIQIAAHFGANVATTSSSAEKLSRAKTLGAEHLINYKEQDWSAEVRKIRKSGPDIIVDHIGQSFWEKNIQALRPGGTLVCCGATTGSKGTTDLARFFFRQLRLIGSTMGSKRDFPQILSLLGSGKLRPVIDRSFPVAQSADAHRYLAEGKQFGKVLITF